MDPNALSTAVARLARSATREFAIDEMLTELCESAGAVLGVHHVGVMGSDGRRTRFVHADSPTITPLEELQEALQQGPCHRCMVLEQPVVVTDLSSPDGEYIWPEFALLAADLGLKAVIAVPLMSRGRTWGTLDLYRAEPHEWTEQEVADALLLADVAVSYLVMAADRDAALAAQEALSLRALHDDLTGLPSRTLLFDRMRHALSTAHRLGTAVAVVFVDLDHFKTVNDTFGHAVGDEVLVAAAQRMASTLRAGDTLARLAGDEFVLVAENLSPAPSSLGLVVSTITDRLAAALAAPMRFHDLDLTVTASMGVAVTTEQPTAEDLLHDADTAMYAAKDRGEGRVVVRDHTLPSSEGWSRTIERDILRAVENDELLVHYQVIQAAASGRVQAVEALLRWQHPVQGLVPAARFVGVADRMGALPQIGRRLIATACADLAAWRAELGDEAPDTAWCNLTPREVVAPGLEDAIEVALLATGLEPRNLGFELVESDYADPDLVGRLHTLHERGHPLSVDDFGTGYSSLSRLLDLPVAVAKIDRSFVNGIPEDSRSRALVEAVLIVARGLALEVVGEGVETRAQLDYLVAAGCHQLQGYYVGRPMSAVDLRETLTGWRGRLAPSA